MKTNAKLFSSIEHEASVIRSALESIRTHHDQLSGVFDLEERRRCSKLSAEFESLATELEDWHETYAISSTE